MKSSRKKPESVSPTFFLEVMNHWATPGVVGAVVGLSLLLLCSGPWGITLGVAASFSGAMFSAVRFFGSNVAAQKKPNSSNPSRGNKRTFVPRVLFPIEPASVPVPNPVPDSLERFLCLLYGVGSETLKSMRSDVNIDAESSLIKCINQIKTVGSWGAELHIDYLARLFGIPYRVVWVSGDARVDDFGDVVHLDPGKSQRIQSGYTDGIQLINHGGGHWTTMFGAEPVVGQPETRNYMNNPGGGDCLFYAIALGFARLICEDFQDITAIGESALFQTWRKLDGNMTQQYAAEALYQLGMEINIHTFNNISFLNNWKIFQQGLRGVVAKSMCEQLTVEGALALEAYQHIQANAGNQDVKDRLIIALYDSSPLYKEFDMLYNIDKRNIAEDLKTNIFKDLYPTPKSIAYTV